MHGEAQSYTEKNKKKGEKKLCVTLCFSVHLCVSNPLKKIMIQTINLQKLFATEEVETTALNGINVEIKDGEFVAIMGPSGCGKSTLLNILGLLDNPSEGEYNFYGTPVANMTERQRAQLRKGSIGFVFQSFNLIDELTVYENTELPLLYLKTPAAERKERVEAVAGADGHHAPAQPLPAAAIGRTAAAHGHCAGGGGQTQADSGR